MRKPTNSRAGEQIKNRGESILAHSTVAGIDAVRDQ